MVFSSRLDWTHTRNPLSLLLEEKRAAGAPLLDLTESNPTHAGIAYAEAEILDALGDSRSLRYEPTPLGLADARQAVAAYYAARGCVVDPSRILLTASTSEAYSFLFKLLCDPGDEILVPRPSYPLFDHLAGLECVRPRQYPLRYQEGWWLDAEEVTSLMSPRTRAILVVNPNNPTGSYLKRGELERISSLCGGVPIICDEVFSDYSLIEDENRIATTAAVDSHNLFTCSGLSKLVGLPQMKLGWIVATGPEASESMDRLEWIADTYLSVSAPVQHAASRWLALLPEFQRRMQARLRENLATTRGLWEPLRVEGGWYAILSLPRVRTDEEWALALLRDRDVVVQPGFFYDLDQPASIVVSLLTDPGILREGLRRIVETAG